MIDQMPRQISLVLAGKICGLSRKAFMRHFVCTNRVRMVPLELFHDGRLYIWTRELGEALGHKITLEEVQSADQKLEAKRAYMVKYRRRRHATI